MDIERIARKRQKNVQEQNFSSKIALYKIAVYYRQNPIPKVLYDCGLERGICWDRTIIIDLGKFEPGDDDLFGVLLDQNQQIIEFSLDSNSTLTVLVQLYQWDNVTHLQNFSQHNRGVGIGNGAMAIEIQTELNAQKN